ncbi:oligosaccharide flippase family protein [Methylacidiphilum caldifontis]|uniref:Polysaccharide biosynthesis protein n=1 Tax=Methylacidiphilum caldifontis TaxID=2795386 RepID=A0A4Y8P8L0_9BACT|nr:oligosaccharide flippase family protein [Methylacidiphilum caldifontis]TFE66587.1 hypothetical protein A7Q10_02090 [Methylacidiphilum caldifontis]
MKVNHLFFKKIAHYTYSSFFSSLKRHLKNLFALWSSTSLNLVFNATILFLLAAIASQKTFALYAIGQAITFLANAWTDVGIAFTVQTLSSQEKKSKSLFEFYYKEGIRLSLKWGIPLGFILVILLFIFHEYGSFAKALSWQLMLLFFCCGIFQNRIGFCSAFLYALGHFKTYSWIQPFSAFLRLFILAPFLLLQGNKIGIGSLLSVDLFSFFSGWMLASFLLHYQKKKLHAHPLSHTEKNKIKEEIIRFMHPSIQANILLSTSHTLGTFAGAFFGGASTVALYTLFQRLNQLTIIALGPLSAYFSRKLKLTENTQQRYKKSKLFILFTIPLSVLFSFILLLGYIAGGKLYSHYAFHALQTFEMFLVCNCLGNLYVIFDNLLCSWKYAGHRLMSSYLAIAKFLLISLFKPSSALLLFAIDALFLALIDSFFLYKFLAFGREAKYEQVYRS